LGSTGSALRTASLVPRPSGDSVARETEAAPLSAEQLAELERRLADCIARAEAVTPWEVIKARALARARQ